MSNEGNTRSYITPKHAKGLAEDLKITKKENSGSQGYYEVIREKAKEITKLFTNEEVIAVKSQKNDFEKIRGILETKKGIIETARKENLSKGKSVEKIKRPTEAQRNKKPREPLYYRALVASIESIQKRIESLEVLDERPIERRSFTPTVGEDGRLRGKETYPHKDLLAGFVSEAERGNALLELELDSLTCELNASQQVKTNLKDSSGVVVTSFPLTSLNNYQVYVIIDGKEVFLGRVTFGDANQQSWTWDVEGVDPSDLQPDFLPISLTATMEGIVTPSSKLPVSIKKDVVIQMSDSKEITWGPQPDEKTGVALYNELASQDLKESLVEYLGSTNFKERVCALTSHVLGDYEKGTLMSGWSDAEYQDKQDYLFFLLALQHAGNAWEGYKSIPGIEIEKFFTVEKLGELLQSYILLETQKNKLLSNGEDRQIMSTLLNQLMSDLHEQKYAALPEDIRTKLRNLWQKPVHQYIGDINEQWIHYNEALQGEEEEEEEIGKKEVLETGEDTGVQATPEAKSMEEQYEDLVEEVEFDKIIEMLCKHSKVAEAIRSRASSYLGKESGQYYMHDWETRRGEKWRNDFLVYLMITPPAGGEKPWPKYQKVNGIEIEDIIKKDWLKVVFRELLQKEILNIGINSGGLDGEGVIKLALKNTEELFAPVKFAASPPNDFCAQLKGETVGCVSAHVAEIDRERQKCLADNTKEEEGEEDAETTAPAYGDSVNQMVPLPRKKEKKKVPPEVSSPPSEPKGDTGDDEERPEEEPPASSKKKKKVEKSSSPPQPKPKEEPEEKEETPETPELDKAGREKAFDVAAEYADLKKRMEMLEKYAQGLVPGIFGGCMGAATETRGNWGTLHNEQQTVFIDHMCFDDSTPPRVNGKAIDGLLYTRLCCAENLLDMIKEHVLSKKPKSKEYIEEKIDELTGSLRRGRGRGISAELKAIIADGLNFDITSYFRKQLDEETTIPWEFDKYLVHIGKAETPEFTKAYDAVNHITQFGHHIEDALDKERKLSYDKFLEQAFYESMAAYSPDKAEWPEVVRMGMSERFFQRMVKKGDVTTYPKRTNIQEVDGAQDTSTHEFMSMDDLETAFRNHVRERVQRKGRKEPISRGELKREVMKGIRDIPSIMKNAMKEKFRPYVNRDEDGETNLFEEMNKMLLDEFWKTRYGTTPRAAAAPGAGGGPASPAAAGAHEETVTISDMERVHSIIARRVARERVRERAERITRRWWHPGNLVRRVGLYLGRGVLEQRYYQEEFRRRQGLSWDEHEMSAADRHQLEALRNADDPLAEINSTNYPIARGRIDRLVDDYIAGRVNASQFQQRFFDILNMDPPRDVAGTGRPRGWQPLNQLIASREGGVRHLSSNILMRLDRFRAHQQLTQDVLAQLSATGDAATRREAVRRLITTYYTTYRELPQFLQEIGGVDTSADNVVEQLHRHSASLTNISARTLDLKIQMLQNGHEAYAIQGADAESSMWRERLKAAGKTALFATPWLLTALLAPTGPIGLAIPPAWFGVKAMIMKYGRYSKEVKDFERNRAVDLAAQQQEYARLNREGRRWRPRILPTRLNRQRRQDRKKRYYYHGVLHQNIRRSTELKQSIDNAMLAHDMDLARRGVDEALARIALHRAHQSTYLGSDTAEHAEQDIQGLERSLYQFADMYAGSLRTTRGVSVTPERILDGWRTSDACEERQRRLWRDDRGGRSGRTARSRFRKRRFLQAFWGGIKAAGVSGAATYLSSLIVEAMGGTGSKSPVDDEAWQPAEPPSATEPPVAEEVPEAETPETEIVWSAGELVGTDIAEHRSPGDHEITQQFRDNIVSGLDQVNDAKDEISFHYSPGVDEMRYAAGSTPPSFASVSAEAQQVINSLTTPPFSAANIDIIEAALSDEQINKMVDFAREQAAVRGNDFLYAMRGVEGIGGFVESLQEHAATQSILIDQPLNITFEPNATLAEATNPNVSAGNSAHRVIEARVEVTPYTSEQVPVDKPVEPAPPPPPPPQPAPPPSPPPSGPPSVPEIPEREEMTVIPIPASDNTFKPTNTNVRNSNFTGGGAAPASS